MSRRPHTYVQGELVIVIDCADLDRSAAFWSAALGYVKDGVASGGYQTLVPADGSGIEVLLQRTHDSKSAKNRIHLDLRTHELEPETSRLLHLGATLLTGEPITEHGWRWHVLHDPDGNEFCVLQPPAQDRMPGSTDNGT